MISALRRDTAVAACNGGNEKGKGETGRREGEEEREGLKDGKMLISLTRNCYAP